MSFLQLEGHVHLCFKGQGSWSNSQPHDIQGRGLFNFNPYEFNYTWQRGKKSEAAKTHTNTEEGESELCSEIWVFDEKLIYSYKIFALFPND